MVVKRSHSRCVCANYEGGFATAGIPFSIAKFAELLRTKPLRSSRRHTPPDAVVES